MRSHHAPAAPVIATLTLLALALSAPPAAAQAALTLDDLEEPRGGDDAVFDVTVTPEQAGKARIVVFLNPPSRPFGLVVYRDDGTEAYSQTGARGAQNLPALQEGPHRFFVRGDGIFQVMHRHLDRLGGSEPVTEANGTLTGTDAWFVPASRDWTLHVEGAVRAEWRDLGGATRELSPPANVTASRGSVYVLTLRGEEGAPYRLRLEPLGPDPTPTGSGTPSPDPTQTPARDSPLPALPLLLAAGLAAARMRARAPR